MQAKLSWLGEQAFGGDVGDLVTMNYKSHRDALLFLQSVLRDHQSVGFLRGPQASGKSSIARQLSRKLPGDVATALVDGAGMQPFAFESNVPPDTGEQADLYWAAMEATGQKDWIDGLYWWNWLVDGSGGPDNTDYTPDGKPAQGELTRAWTN